MVYGLKSGYIAAEAYSLLATTGESFEITFCESVYNALILETIIATCFKFGLTKSCCNFSSFAKVDKYRFSNLFILRARVYI